ncbi:Sir2 family NAD-dependent protein deacetylase [bacterium]|nr:Sir2 family NAD-dependent protein deacetylase [bacterium]
MGPGALPSGYRRPGAAGGWPSGRRGPVPLVAAAAARPGRRRIRLATSARILQPESVGSARAGTGVDEIVGRWRDAERVVVLTGAGLSTDSGIPDFRSPGGRWETYRPVTLQEFQSSEASRRAYWRYKGETWQVVRAARPNPAHEALVALAHAGRIDLLVTQNVDGLHERSGFPADRLVNVHGTDAEVACLRCGRREPRATAQAEWEAGVDVPACPCGAPWKPATISFGQSLVEEDLERAFRAAADCELFVAAGTSLVVGPINRMFDLARGAGAFTAILTASDTPYDSLARARSGERLGEVLPRIARGVLGEIH